jgi:hypothetical protein
MGERTLRTALASGVLKQIWRGVVIHAADSRKLQTRVAAALLVVGHSAVVSGSTALALHGLTAADTGNVHITVPYKRSVRSRPGLVVHQNRFQEADVVELEGLPVFCLELALADFLCDGDKLSAFASLDQAMAGHSEESREELRQLVARRLRERDDRRGVAKGLMMVDLATGKADSPPESMFRLIVVEAGLPVPEAQYEIFTVDGRLLYVLDIAWPEARIALEYDGFAAHEERGNGDRDRDGRMAGRGWITLRATVADLRDPSRIISELSNAFARRSRS